MYRKPASTYRRTASVESVVENEPPIIVKDEIENIPLPNESEIVMPTPDFEDDALRSLPPFRFMGRDFFIDDIILIGLLFILMQEQVADEFLLLILLYIFLF